MKKYEYKLVEVKRKKLGNYTSTDDAAMESVLNKLGAEGWELVSVPNNGFYYFKREVE